MARAAQAQIDLRALQHNLRRVREIAPHCRVMAMIKANGYGHGMVRVAQAFSGASAVDALGVASINEAIILREAGVATPITLLEGFFEPAELVLIQQYDFEIVVHHLRQLEIIEATSFTTPVTVWLKVDSGMHRLGFAPEKVPEVWRRLGACRGVRGPVRLMTHLASADDPASPQTQQQLACFDVATVGMAAERSIANSAAILGWPQTHRDLPGMWVRPGIMLYGVSPFMSGTAAAPGVALAHPCAAATSGVLPHEALAEPFAVALPCAAATSGILPHVALTHPCAADHDLRPVMTLTSRLIAVNHYRKGDAIGYAASWVCPHDMPVGVVAMGYGDGYPRHAVSGTPVLVNGQRVSLIGRVSMDMLSVDLSSQPQACIGDAVTLWGEGLPVEEVARWANTIPYQLLCGVTQRVKFVELL